MDTPVQVTVRHGDDVYHAAARPDERLDQLLLRSLHHFGLDPAHKGDWRLKLRGQPRADEPLTLDGAIGDQVLTGCEVVLEPNVAGNRRMATGSY